MWSCNCCCAIPNAFLIFLYWNAYDTVAMNISLMMYEIMCMAAELLFKEVQACKLLDMTQFGISVVFLECCLAYCDCNCSRVFHPC